MRSTSILTAIGLVSLGAAAYAQGHAHIRTPVEIPMRDDPNTLAGDIYLPQESGQWPAILIQTPYDKNGFADRLVEKRDDRSLLESPDYAFVVLDQRGFSASAEESYFGAPSAAQDGYDAVEWTAAQAWCTGDVGTWGVSALGAIQWDTAQEAPPSLRACMPMMSNDAVYFETYYPGGVYARNALGFIDLFFGSLNLVRALPTYNDIWAGVEASTSLPDQIAVPMLHISGWYDHNTPRTILGFQRLQEEGAPGAAGQQKLLIGPWSHNATGGLRQGQLSFPAAEAFDSFLGLEFFDYYLRGIDNGYPDRPAVSYYRINTQQFLASDAWPPATTQTDAYYLHADGTLAPLAPESPDAALSYLADPEDPVPTVYGARLVSFTQGPGDIARLRERGDVLAFQTPPLEEALTIEGDIVATLYVTADVIDTDLAVRLVEIFPDGRDVLHVDGIRRASLRNGFETRELLEPDTVYEVPVELYPVSITIPPGNALGFFVAPSNFDLWDVNLQDGTSISLDSDGVPTPGTIALQTNSVYPSHIDLPIVKADLPVEGEDAQEGEELGPAAHSADTDGDFALSLNELLRVVQLYTLDSYHCDATGEDGFAPADGPRACTPHDSDYAPTNWTLEISEFLRAVQLYNSAAYAPCIDGEDGICV